MGLNDIKEISQKTKQLRDENIELYKKALNDVAETTNGKIILSALRLFCCPEICPNIENPNALLRAAVLRNFYYEMITTYLEPETRRTIENERWKRT